MSFNSLNFICKDTLKQYCFPHTYGVFSLRNTFLLDIIFFQDPMELSMLYFFLVNYTPVFCVPDSSSFCFIFYPLKL